LVQKSFFTACDDIGNIKANLAAGEAKAAMEESTKYDVINQYVNDKAVIVWQPCGSAVSLINED